MHCHISLFCNFVEATYKLHFYVKKNSVKLEVSTIEYFSVAKMKVFVTFQLNFLKKPGVPHKNEMLPMEIDMSTYSYTQKTCVEVRAS